MKHFLILLLPLLVITACSHEEHRKEVRDLPVVKADVRPIISGTAPHSREISGSVRPVIRAEISPRLQAEIIAIRVETGQQVEKGELLVELDSSVPAAALREAEVALSQAQRNLARESRLLKKHAATPTSVKNLRDAVNIAKAKISQAKTRLGFTSVRAPFSGVVSAIPANVGDLAVPGRPLLHLEEMSRLEIAADIPETLLAEVHKGVQMPVVIPSAGLHLQGVVTEISPAVNPASRTARAKLAITPEHAVRARIFSGMFARITVDQGSPQVKSSFVSEAALKPYGQLQRIFILNDGRAEMRLVRLGATVDINGEKMVEILSGAEAGEKALITAGDLQNGQPVATHATAERE